MREIVPYTWDWQKEYQEIRAELTTRSKYRLGGRPCPTELTNVAQIIKTLDQMEPILKTRINQELEESAVSQIQIVVASHNAILAHPQHLRRPQHELGEIPKTPSEEILGHVSRLRYSVEHDARWQDEARSRLDMQKYCRRDCPYPDVCRDEQWHYGCFLLQLYTRVEERGWLGGKKIVSVPYTEADLYALRRLRQSQYYDPSHEKLFRSVWKHRCLYQPWLCRRWGRELLGSGSHRCGLCRKTYYDILGIPPPKPKPVY
jgi:hypothetical protein